MTFDIDEEIKQKSDRCRDGFSCLKGENNCLCEVESFINNKLLFIKPDKGGVCEYKTSFGYSYYCACPTRKELFYRYKV